MGSGGEHSLDTDERDERDELGRRVAAALSPDFEVLGPLDSGRMAYVYLARERALERLVAVKVLRPRAGADEVARARFEREARSAAGISHPCVPAVHRVERLDNGLPCIVQEYVEGRTLEDRLAATGPVEPGEARRILTDLAGGLAAAHAEGVIHRDVRPGNVILARVSGRAVLADFGLAGFREAASAEAPRLTREGQLLGDPRYTSPEALAGEPVTEQTDIYSLGVVGYEILTGGGPFEAASTPALVAAHLGRPPRALPAELRDRDPALADLLRRCLDKSPSRRPRAEDVVRALAGPGGSAGPRGGDTGVGRAGGAGLRGLPGSVAAFIDELKRRRVYRVVAGYWVTAFVLLEGASLVLPTLRSPEWVYASLVILAVVGLPVVAVLAWVYDLTARGIERTAPDPAHAAARSRFAAYLGVGLLATVALAALLGWLVLR